MASKKDNSGDSKRSIMEKVMRRFVPGYKKAQDKTARHKREAKYYDSVYDAIKKRRELRKKYLPTGYGNLKKMTPEEHNKAWHQYTQRPDVRKVQDKITGYKVRQKTKR